jgi:P27 family predicted phage terminase small subunit
MTQPGRQSANKLLLVTDNEAHRHARPTAPKHLGAPERELWNSVTEEFDIESTAAHMLLVGAMEAHQRARECREKISKEGLTIKGPQGPRQHPLVATERAARQQMVSCLKKLGVEL